ncbi:hypothetical protein DVB69_01875 [Sporosarcina sp. BI001-red]|uniref:hypothetical protein n=1 Tax=Sporosarcina sp. BI001-red TaxID=2282866 RepID=UPI000E27FF63|nr:hypothetical protein [Sporosarcina sp. BI001-red]REB09582.1 hypothetical protein DVB69_01875 [Sporosarcina sp. BI001-red]
MSDMLKKLSESIDNHDTKITVLDGRVVGLEELTGMLIEKDRQHEEKLHQMETQNLKLENTVLSTSRETQEIVKAQADKMYELAKSSMSYQTASAEQAHELQMAKLSAWSTFALKMSGAVAGLTGTGGLVYYLFTHFLK